MVEVIAAGRSLAETPTWSVATVITVLVFVCLLVERSIYRFGKWLKRTRRKALAVSLEKMKEELMLLGLISLMLGQWARWISEICVNSSLFTSRFFICSQEDYDIIENIHLASSFSFSNESVIPPRGLNTHVSHQCGEGREPFVSQQGLEQLHRFLFVLGITHVLYSCLAVALAMTKIYSWRKWEFPASIVPDGNLQDQGDEETDHLHFPSHVSSMEQESDPYLDALLSTTIQKFYNEIRLPCIAFGFHHRGTTICRILIIFITIWSGAWKMNFKEFWGLAGRFGVMLYCASSSIFMVLLDVSYPTVLEVSKTNTRKVGKDPKQQAPAVHKEQQRSHTQIRERIQPKIVRKENKRE